MSGKSTLDGSGGQLRPGHVASEPFLIGYIITRTSLQLRG